MCGIFGLIVPGTNGIFKDEEEFIDNMMIVGARRGEHGTGTYWVHADKLNETADYYKTAGNPYNLLGDKGYREYLGKARLKAKAFIGHHRAATRGKHTSENAHPFQSKHITMVHNGTIHWGLTKYDKDIEVDSHALTIALSEEGTGILQTVSGAFACVWHDATDGSLNFAKNDQRPLSMVKTDDGKYFFASEMGMLLWALYRAKPGRPQPKIVELKNNQHYKFNLAQLGDPEVIPLPEKKYQSSAVYSTGSGYYRNQERTEKKTSRRTERKTILGESAEFRIVKAFKHKDTTWVYLCMSTESEMMWFRSMDEFEVGPKLWWGELIEYPVIDKFQDLYYTRNVPWYRINTTSIVPADADEVTINGKKLDSPLCIDCGDKLPDDMSSGDIFQISTNIWRGMCPGCVQVNKFSYGVC